MFASLNCFGGMFKRDKQSQKTVGENGEDFSVVRDVHLFSYKDLILATKNFHPENKIGAGGFGTVYKGVLKDGAMVAVKQLSAESRQGVREFLTEIATISAIKHENIVTLHGCCIEEDHRILVYQYMENNSISHALFGSSNGTINLDWQTRCKICVGTARGFAYLHEEVTPYIVHRDIKASNVLLDGDLNPKIADFGLAKLFPDNITHISTRVAGTLGYLAPEYAMRGRLTRKADVYSFGVLVIEIISGRSNINTSLSLEEKVLLKMDGKIWRI
ncbi:cold-responsive protein kinase 1 isoform X2 [Cryptomeria japonica]|uniref:cold-responsive protein kinase 1 isoform X2 n=1 Tax=Cryptomeria japonica TaxID=3369 RepID=UPI0025AD36A8|nr:cold-responsive protein kinase 1 isoform X2 [Cryptomeria japonica]